MMVYNEQDHYKELQLVFDKLRDAAGTEFLIK